MADRSMSGARRGRRLRSPPIAFSAAARADPRTALEEAAAARGVDWRRLSLAIGRNAAYVQQYLKRGTPRRLDEADRAALAAYLEIDEALLRTASAAAPPPPAVVTTRARPARELVALLRLDLRVAAGAGRVAEGERALAHVGMTLERLRALTRSPLDQLSVVEVEGDSMRPTLHHGDEILVDAGDAGAPRGEGIYVLRRDDALAVKRLRAATDGTGGAIDIVSDNANEYPPERGVPIDTLHIVGRVLWFARAL